MESSKDPILPFDRVKEMLTTHIGMLLQHMKYLNGIKSEKISDAEAIEYFEDNLGLSILHFETFKKSMLPILIGQLHHRINAFLKLKEIANHGDTEAVISTLYLVMVPELTRAAQEEKIKKRKKTNLIDKVIALYGDLNIIRMMTNLLTTILPPSHTELSEVIKTSLIDKDMNEWESGTICGYGYVVNWKAMIDSVIGEDTETDEKKEEPKKKTDAEARKDFEKLRESEKATQSRIVGRDKNHTPFTDALIKIYEATQKVINREQLNKQTKIKSAAEFYEVIYQNVIVYHEILPLTEELKKTYEVMSGEAQLLEDICQLYHETRNEIEARCKAYRETIAQLLKLVNQKRSNSAWQHHASELDHLITGLHQLKTNIATQEAEWPEAMVGVFSFTRITEKGDASKLKLKEIKSKIKEIEADIWKLEEKEPSNPQAEERSEREVYLAEQKRINQERRETVARSRVERAKQKKRSIVKKEKEEKKEKTSSVIYKNVEVEKCLLELSDTYFQLLLDLYAGKKGIHYSEVYHLITNQLIGGSVEEIGNGSSHKRIRIDKYTIELITHNDDDANKNKRKKLKGLPSKQDKKDEKKEKKDEKPIDIESNVSIQAVGGFFDPHGKQHAPGVMSRFNMELVVSVVISAGITPEILKNFEARRQQARLQPSGSAYRAAS